VVRQTKRVKRMQIVYISNLRVLREDNEDDTSKEGGVRTYLIAKTLPLLAP
jgi:hypothetical protein